jgi:hypothetical protein
MFNGIRASAIVIVTALLEVTEPVTIAHALQLSGARGFRHIRTALAVATSNFPPPRSLKLACMLFNPDTMSQGPEMLTLLVGVLFDTLPLPPHPARHSAIITIDSDFIAFTFKNDFSF